MVEAAFMLFRKCFTLLPVFMHHQSLFMRHITGLLATLLLSACTINQTLTYNVPTLPPNPVEPAPQKVIVLTTFDPAVYHNKNKKELTALFADTLVSNIARELVDVSKIDALPLKGKANIFTTADAGSIFKMVTEHQSSHAIVIREVDIYFEQTDVEVTKTENGKSRKAYYDIGTIVKFDLYNGQQKLESLPVHLSAQHSSRPVISGLLAAGPSFAGNKDEFYEMIVVSQQRFLSSFFPSIVSRKRSLFTSGPFKAIGTAIRQNNYELALQQSLQLTESLRRDIRAKAYYNCAVLSERFNKKEDVQRYLNRSLEAMYLEVTAALKTSLFEENDH